MLMFLSLVSDPEIEDGEPEEEEEAPENDENYDYLQVCLFLKGLLFTV